MGRKDSGNAAPNGLILTGYIIMVIAVVCGVSLAAFLSTKQENASTEEEKLGKGQEEAVPVMDESPYADREDLQLTSCELYSYDAAGNQAGSRKYDASGEILSANDYSYDREGRLIIEASMYSIFGEPYYDTYTYQYDEQGRKIYYLHTANHNEPPYEVHYYYRDLGEGVTIKLSQQRSDGETEGYSGWITNASGDRISYCSYDEEGNLSNYNFRKFDEQNRPVYWRVVNGGLDAEPLREAYLDWDDEANACTTTIYEPPGHVNELEYISYTENGDIKRDLLYMSGYSGYGENTPYIRGQEGKYQEGIMDFWEGYWAAYDGENMLWEMETDHTELQSYQAHRYEGDLLMEELSFENGDYRSMRFKRYEYDKSGRLLARYEYKITDEEISLELSDGSRVRWGLEADDSGMAGLRRVTRISKDGEMLEDFVLDEKERLTEQYTKEWGELWTENPPVDPGEIFAGGEDEFQ